MPNSNPLEDGLKPQAQAVLGMLRAAGERGVSNGDFIRAYIERFGGRICEMRKLGWQIETRREGQGRSRYFLRAEPAGVGAGVLTPQGSGGTSISLDGASVDPGGSLDGCPESEGAVVVGVGGNKPDGDSLFDPNLFAINFGYGNSERAA